MHSHEREQNGTPAPPPITLTIAGSDSGGGAGIQADLKTFHAFGTFGTSVITAITAQNTRGVSAVHPVPPDIVRAQVQAVASDLPPAACKSGMLATAALVETVADAIEAARLPNYVLDPVMVATSGDRLLNRDAVAAVAARLLPLCTLCTPNLPEARILAGREPDADDADDDGHELARVLVERGASAALVKGGHADGDPVVDVLFDGQEVREWRHARLRTANTHGTGCTLSAAVAALLARGRALPDAVEVALDFVHRAIAAAPGLGSGHGPLNHFVEAG